MLCRKASSLERVLWRLREVARRAALRLIACDPDINPYVYMRVGTLETHNQGGTVIGYSYRLDLSAMVFGTVSFNRARAPMELWADSTMAVASRDRASSDVEAIVGQLADSFLNAWLKANPK